MRAQELIVPRRVRPGKRAETVAHRGATKHLGALYASKFALALAFACFGPAKPGQDVAARTRVRAAVGMTLLVYCDALVHDEGMLAVNVVRHRVSGVGWPVCNEVLGHYSACSAMFLSFPSP